MIKFSTMHDPVNGEFSITRCKHYASIKIGSIACERCVNHVFVDSREKAVKCNKQDLKKVKKT